ncbi:unnamed protein product [Rotaria magnacalcarata]|uniref:Uncharacterized protein n=1 Tax=Rotaria magnacalcarata TaxID=392030 RepID=A0A816JZY6_9BILA|nr:unnamed protein product [Rotaria magnacalcarata]CAF4800404.1 unnamed protein product [Rotaria magnacalcarata]
MPSSDEDLQKYVGRSLSDVRKEIESQGCEVCTVRIGSCSTGSVPIRLPLTGESEQPRRFVVVYDGDDPENKVTSIRHG